MSTMKVLADSPWKDVCESKLDLAFALLWPGVFGRLDWEKDYEGLDGELRKLTADVLTGNRIADRLIKAFDRATGDPRYLHLEVQGKKEKGFRRRVHACNARAEERFASHVTSLVVLTDTNPRWRPRRYVAGCFPAEGVTSGDKGPGRKERPRYEDERTLRFLTVKLIDFEGREAQLEADDNPMGLFLAAHLAALRTRRDEEGRAAAKLRLLSNLRARKMGNDDLAFWARMIDWLLQLPKAREDALWRELEEKDKEENMAFLSWPERRGLEKGMRQSLTSFLNQRHKGEAQELLSLLAAVKDESRLAALCDEVFAAEGLDGVRAALTSAAGLEP